MSQTEDHSTRRAGLPPEKLAHLEKRMWSGLQKAARAQTIPRRPPDAPPPLSYNQQQLWFLEQMTPTNAAYNIPIAYRLRGALDARALERAVGEVIRRHEILRTTFTVEEGRPVQVVHPPVDRALDVVDVAAAPGAPALDDLINAEARRPFDLERGPLFRAQLLRSGADDCVFMTTMHHIISDGWSMGVFAQELSALYTAFRAGAPSPLSELPIQYGDFTAWQRQWLEGEALKAQVDWWRRQLAGAPPDLALPTDRPRPAMPSFCGAVEGWMLPASFSRELKALARGEGVTLFIALLAAFGALLYRYTGQADILIGSPFANRNRSELEQLIGFFSSPVILRADAAGNPTFRELLARMRAVTLATFDHQDLPFDYLVKLLHPNRAEARPLFQVLFVLQNAPMAPPEFTGLTMEPMYPATDTAKVDLSMSATDLEQGLSVVLEYATDLFDPDTIGRLFDHFRTMLEAAVAGPDRRLSELPLLGAAERRRLLIDWNNTARPRPAACVHELFAARAAEAPQAVAVSYEDQHLTYGELNRRANQLARHLRRLGVGPESLVGICVERSLEMVVAALGVLKAGGAYLPLDPSYPRERLAFMIEDARVPVLLTQGRLARDLAFACGRVVAVDDDWEAIARESGDDPAPGAGSGNLAYVIYTSGSTGRPKGVMVTHANLAGAWTAYDHAYRLSAAPTCHLQMASMSFDVFSGDLVRALCSGGRLVICPHELLLTPESLYDLMRREGVDCGDFVPVVLSSLVDHLIEAGQRLDFMRTVVAGADVWKTADHVRASGILGPDTHLYNTYGVSEATIDSTCFDKGVSGWPFPVTPIGRPFANTQLYLLDAHQCPVPVGVAGELYIGGSNVARGYLNRPDLTAERFVPNPFGDGPGERLYRTGDLARYLPDGNVEFLARVDDQVKIRGFRIELGEIESVLGRHPAVARAVVAAREDTPGTKRLVAYVVPVDRGAPPAPGDLRSFLIGELPEYMVPSAFMALDALPLTPSGKVDRRGLPVPDQARQAPEETFVAPRTEIETVLADTIFAAVLGVERVGVNDNFFDLGGSSLQATQIMSRVRATFHVNIPLRAILAAPTVAGLAEAIRLARESDPDAEAASFNPLTYNFDRDAVLDDDIVPQGAFEHNPDPRRIFLTGATGFVGLFMLRELLSRTSADIFCLVRAPDARGAMDRLVSGMERYLVWDESLRPRIVPVVGDLARPLLGLSEAEFNELAATMDVIYHCGAWVNYVLPYPVLRGATVRGVKEVLRLAGRGKVKAVHQTSTTAVYAGDNTPLRLINEQSPIGPVRNLTLGYSQSKWVCEKILDIAKSRGFPVCVYRLGRVFGDSVTGACQTGDFIWRMVKGCIQLGAAPEMYLDQNLIPVDYVAKVVVHLASRPQSCGRAFHVYLPQATTLEELLDFARGLGYPVRSIPAEEWMRELESDRSRDNAMYPMLAIFGGSGAGAMRFECPETLEALRDAPFSYPAVDERLLAAYFSYHIQTGFLPPPAGGARA